MKAIEYILVGAGAVGIILFLLLWFYIIKI